MPVPDALKKNRLYVLLWALLLAAVSLMLWKPWQAKAPDPSVTGSPYLDLRYSALNARPADFGLVGELGSGDVYGVVMDWDYGKGFVTLVAMRNGDSNLYMENGGAFFGGQGYPAIKSAAESLLELSRFLWVKAERIKDVPAPLPGHVRFFFLTPGGLWSGQDLAENVQKGSSDWSKSFRAANDLITQWRYSEAGKASNQAAGSALPQKAPAAGAP